MSGVHDDREQEWIDRHWPEYEDEARQLLRDLKGQPPHVTDAGASSTCTCRDCLSESLDSMLEAMARA